MNKQKLVETIIELCIEHHLSVMVNMTIDVTQKNLLSYDLKTPARIKPTSKVCAIRNNSFKWGCTE